MKKLGFKLTVLICTIAASVLIIHTSAQAEEAACMPEDKSCLLAELDKVAATITEDNWRDQTYRELAKLLAKEGRAMEAAQLIARVTNPDTKAMTIRGIGMEAAKTILKPDDFASLFATLRAEAEKIEHKPSYAIALTYIAMSQAFAGDDTGAMKTAMDMENPSLRNKALAEAAEIQAERGVINEAFKSLDAIEDPSFRNKAYFTISKIFTEKKNYKGALESAYKIQSAYLKADALRFMLTHQISPEETAAPE